jgi:hypothetical protein
MLASFVDATVTEWVQSINPSHGSTNLALGAHASTYPIDIPKRHLFSHPVMVMMVVAIKATSRCSD